MADYSFDVVSKVNMAEVVNAVDQTQREMKTRYDFRGSKSTVDLDEKKGQITILADDEMKLRAVLDILQTRLVRRGVGLRALEYGRVEDAAGGMLRQVITLRQGIPQDKAKQMTAAIRVAKLKVKAEVRGDEIRVSGPKKDDLQAVIQLLRSQDFGLELQFVNYR